MRVNWHGLAGARVRRKVGRIGRERAPKRHPRVTDGPSWRPILADRGVRLGLPDAPADPRRVPLPVAPEPTPAREPALFRRSARAGGGRPSTRSESATRSYSFGIANPGAIVLHDYPTSLTEQFRPDENDPLVDLAAVDVLRDRERGVPRYNEFRTLMHRKPVTSFEELTQDARVASELRDVYGHVDRVDLMVGLYAERRPKGFAFSDTAFRVFVLMASRRLKSDRFFTSDYTREVYTQTGLDWIDNATMSKILLRHYMELAPVIRRDNAFKPW